MDFGVVLQCNPPAWRTVDLARQAAIRAAIDVAERIEAFAALEAELITSPDPQFRFHSGVPA